MTQIGRKIFPVLATLVLAGCQTLSAHQGPEFAPNLNVQAISAGFEGPRLLPAADFLAPDLMQSPLHNVAPQTYNDGYANTYQIETPDHVFVVQGTPNVKIRIREIEATEILRHKSTIGKAASAVGERTLNLVETPYRAAKGGYDRFAATQTPGEALMVIPSGAAEIAGDVGHGLQELGSTAWRITTSAAGTKCQGFGGCASKAGRDIWSGFNSLAGKHNAAKEIHYTLGTDPYTDNKVLQREVDRLAYADAYTSTTVKFGFTMSNVNILDPLATGVGYYNNGEFVARYEDAHKRRKKEKAQMLSWGAEQGAINRLYKNKAFTHTTRTRLTQVLSRIGTPPYRAHLIEQASTSKTRFVANSRLSVFEYLSKLDSDGKISGYIEDAPAAIAITKDGRVILPFAADYLSWTADIAPMVENLAQAAGNNKAEIHVIGKASPLFKTKAQALGVKVVEVND